MVWLCDFLKDIMKGSNMSKMSEQDWKRLKYFNKHEFGAPDKMSKEHLYRLDLFRDKLNTPIKITSDYRHGDSGSHGNGIATDCMFPLIKFEDLFDVFLQAERFDFGGIGIYKGWELKGKMLGGLHLDSRDQLEGARWICVKENGKQSYYAFTLDNLKKFGFIK